MTVKLVVLVASHSLNNNTVSMHHQVWQKRSNCGYFED